MKQFCPSCEDETECEHAAELYECQECGEDFAKYIVGRNTNPGFYNYADKQSETSVVVNKPSNSDVLMTQDVLTTIKISFNIEDFRPYADKHRNKYVLSGPHWPLVLRYPILFDEYEKLVKINAQETYRLNIEVSRLQSEIARLTAENAALKDANRWISVDERLPEKSGWYTVLRYDHTAKYYQDYKFFGLTRHNWLGTYGDYNRIVFWRENLPLPDVPAEQAEGE